MMVCSKTIFYLGLISLALLLTGCRTELYTQLPEKEVNEMMALLLRHDVDAVKSRDAKENWNLTVSRSQFAYAMQVLEQYGYPRTGYTSMGDVFKREGLVSSPAEERVRYIYALSQELGKTISHVDGVLSARVHIVLPNDDPFSERAFPSSASVFIKSMRASNIDANIPQIKQLVVNSVEGLSYDKVSVVLFQSEEGAGTAAGLPLPVKAAMAGGNSAPFAGRWWSLAVIVVLLFAALSGAAWYFKFSRTNKNAAAK